VFPWRSDAGEREEALARLALLRDHAARGPEPDVGSDARRTLIELVSPAPGGFLSVSRRG
jgi:hypothetical protein